MSATQTENGNGNDVVAPEVKKVQLTEREQEILSKAWNCMKTQPEIDYARLAAETGMTNPRSASNAWGGLKKKLFTGTPPATPTKAKADGEGTTGTQKRKRSPAKKAATDDATAGEGEETPTKKKRTPAKKRASPVKKVEEQDGEDEKPLKAPKVEPEKNDEAHTETADAEA